MKEEMTGNGRRVVEVSITGPVGTGKTRAVYEALLPWLRNDGYAFEIHDDGELRRRSAGDTNSYTLWRISAGNAVSPSEPVQIATAYEREVERRGLRAGDSTMKCVVHECTNHKDQGTFVGDFCAPCWNMIVTGVVGPSSNFIATLRERMVKAERERDLLQGRLTEARAARKALEATLTRKIDLGVPPAAQPLTPESGMTDPVHNGAAHNGAAHNDVTVFTCGPDPEHVCDGDGPEVEIVSECRRCEGTGTVSPYGGVLNCPKCKGTGQRVSGSSASCSVCEMSAFDRSFWEGP